MATTQIQTASLKHFKTLDPEHLPATSGFLLIPSQLPFRDLLRLQHVLTGRTIYALIERGSPLDEETSAYLQQENLRILEVNRATATPEAYAQQLAKIVAEGAVVILIPPQVITGTAPLTVIPGERLGFWLSAEVPTLPVYVHHPADVKLAVGPQPRAEATVMAFGEILIGPRASLAGYLESLTHLSERAFSVTPGLDLSLGYAMILGFKKNGSKCRVVDGKDEKSLSFSKVFAAAIALSRVIRKETQKRRIGIVLPPGLGGLIANVAVLMAGRIPVNLNFTAARTAVELAIKKGEIDRLITADAFVRKMHGFPWPPNKQLILLERLMPTLKTSIAKWLVLSKILPSRCLAFFLGVSTKGGNNEAVLLFTSGSSGEPKGVVLTHRNLIANVSQFGSRLHMDHRDAVLGCLPLFHSFGSTVTLWYPVIQGLQLITYPSPLEAKRLAELVDKYQVTLLLATPTFLRGFLRGVNREQLSSVKLVVTGAEKLPSSLAESFAERFEKSVMEGYGLTETSPVSNINMPNPSADSKQNQVSMLPTHRAGSVGQLLPGLAVRMIHPETDEPLAVFESGIICFKGANIFPGYLKDIERTAAVLSDDGWFRTGDVGRLDADGFLYIEGRLSRFSKIAGEMIPHETVEEALNKALGLEGEDTRQIAVVGVPDIERGEALILLTTMMKGSEQQEIIELRHRLLEAGVPSLWIPKKLLHVREIPLLASGKLDVQGCQNLTRSIAP